MLLALGECMQEAPGGHAPFRQEASIACPRSRVSVAHAKQDGGRVMRLRGGVQYYEDRMDLDAAIKALKQVWTPIFECQSPGSGACGFGGGSFGAGI